MGERYYWQCWEFAGAVGVDPRPFTWGELCEMYAARARHDWDLTSFLAASLLSAVGGKPVDPASINPFAAKAASGKPRARGGEGDGGKIRVPMSALKDVVCKAFSVRQ